METLQAGRSDPWYMLDNAHTCLQMLAASSTPSVPTVAPLDPSAFARTLQIPFGRARGGDDQVETTDVGVAAPTLAPRAPAPLAEHGGSRARRALHRRGARRAGQDPEHFPAGNRTRSSRTRLVTIRRSFHTLKGSGRMVGARDSREFAWAIENLLNRLLDNTITRSPQILAVIRDAVAALPQLIDQLENGPGAAGGHRRHRFACARARVHQAAAGGATRASGRSDSGAAEKKAVAAAPPVPAPPPAPPQPSEAASATTTSAVEPPSARSARTICSRTSTRARRLRTSRRCARSWSASAASPSRMS